MPVFDRNRVKDLWNKARGVPVRFELGEQASIVKKVMAADLGGLPMAALRDRAEGLKEGGPVEGERLVETCALIREVAHRTIGLQPFGVQVLAGLAMHEGMVAELATGEGKTLAAVFTAVLGGLGGKGVHVLTFNDYLARRDASWMGPIYEFFGLSVGCVRQGMEAGERQKAYAADVTYATAREAGFDFLRDNLCFSAGDMVHRPFNLAIVDEADSILIDEARVPMVIAGALDEAAPCHTRLAGLVRVLREGVEYSTDAERRNIFLTEKGIDHIEASLRCGPIHDPENVELLTQVNLALHAEHLLRRDVDYIVRSGRIEIVDEFTGRVVRDRHWPDGLQAAVEAKEGLGPGAGGKVLGSITLQHFLNLYPRLCGMTATARPAAEDLYEFYGMQTAVIPPNRPCIRRDLPPLIFTRAADRTAAVVEEIRGCQSAGRPVLVGTANIRESESLAAALVDAGIRCSVLNAKNDEAEAAVIARAGAPGAVTISTNMAGRGTDIKLGGDREQEKELVLKLGGLLVIGTNLHESRRIDDQLRGRAGRQGDPGGARFYLSMEDDLFVRHGLKEYIPCRVLEEAGHGPVTNRMVAGEVRRAQRIIEGQNREIRKMLFRYSTLVEEQRELLQGWRRSILTGEIVPEPPAGWTMERLERLSTQNFTGRPMELLRAVTLYNIDRNWTDHLAYIEELRDSINLVAAGGKSPLDEFYRIVSGRFGDLRRRMQEGVLEHLNAFLKSSSGPDGLMEAIKGPSSTWTYLVNDNQFEASVNLVHAGGIGSASVAAALYWPIFLLWLAARRWWKRGKRE